jgi:hypothetical protein
MPNTSDSFPNLPPGTDGVEETQPVGYVSVSDKDGGDLGEIRPITVTFAEDTALHSKLPPYNTLTGAIPTAIEGATVVTRHH